MWVCVQGNVCVFNVFVREETGSIIKPFKIERKQYILIIIYGHNSTAPKGLNSTIMFTDIG